MQNKNIGGTDNKGQDHTSKNAVQDDFDSHVKELLTQAEIAPSQGLFEQIEQKLHTRPTFWQREWTGKQRRFMYGFPAAAVVVLAVLGGLFWKFYVTVPAGSPLQNNPGSSVTVGPVPKDIHQGPDLNQPVTKKDGGEIAAAAAKAVLPTQRDEDNSIVRAKRPAKESQRSPDLVPPKVPGAPAVQRLAHNDAPQPDKRNDLSASRTGLSGQNQNGGLDQSKIASVAQKHINNVDNVAGPLKEEAASLATKANAVRSKALAGLQVPGADISQQKNQTVSKALASTGTEGANEALSGGEDNTVEEQAVATRSRKKKGFFKGIFTHVKERVNEISESVVEEEPGKTTYNLGFVAVTAYK